MSNSIHDKIAALLARSESRGNTEAEAEEAMRTARKLMRKHGITAEDVANRSDACLDFAERTVRTGTELSILEKILLRPIAEFTETRFYAVQKPDSDIFDIRFFGYRVDTELADYVYMQCKQSVNAEWHKYKVRLPKGDQAKARFTFTAGMALRLKERLEELTQKDESTGTDLIVLKNQLVLAAMQATGKTPKQENMVVKYDPSVPAFYDGHAAGDSVRFHREVADPASRGVKQIGG